MRFGLLNRLVFHVWLHKNGTTYHQRHLLFKELKEKKGIQGFIINKFNTLDKGERQAQNTYKKMIDSDKDVTKTLGFIKMPAKYFREHFALNIEEALSKVTCPVLAFNGTKDFQANHEKLKRLNNLSRESMRFMSSKI